MWVKVGWLECEDALAGLGGGRGQCLPSLLRGLVGVEGQDEGLRRQSGPPRLPGGQSTERRRRESPRETGERVEDPLDEHDTFALEGSSIEDTLGAR